MYGEIIMAGCTRDVPLCHENTGNDETVTLHNRQGKRLALHPRMHDH